MSHPSWVCGLKHTFVDEESAATIVTPFVGVWIETEYYIIISKRRRVTPFVGVWIETEKAFRFSHNNSVTPFVGVWIETHKIKAYK